VTAADPATADTIEALGRALDHPDRAELLYQLAEIVGERTYLRHGIEVPPGAVVMDVGANVGVAAAFFAGVCKAATVHSFEPVAPLFDFLARNLSPYEACVVHPFGLSESSGRAVITYYARAPGMSGLYAEPDADRDLVRTCMTNLGVPAADAERELANRYEPTRMECELRTLSSVIADEHLDRIDLLKIDVEKAELDVVRGIDDADWPAIAQVAAEVHDINGQLAEFTRLVEERGFTVAIDQDPIMRGTPVHMVYARRS
jgi:31-O-methyltransferase